MSECECDSFVFSFGCLFLFSLYVAAAVRNSCLLLLGCDFFLLSVSIHSVLMFMFLVFHVLHAKYVGFSFLSHLVVVFFLPQGGGLFC